MTALNSLRAQLSFHCNLQNITLKDLDELKWSTKRIIILSLINSAPGLREKTEIFDDLIDRRSSQLRKPENSNREIRADSERMFRTAFIRAYLDILQERKWPLALEAFSDPLPLLLDHKDTFLSSVSYLLKVTVLPFVEEASATLDFPDPITKTQLLYQTPTKKVSTPSFAANEVHDPKPLSKMLSGSLVNTSLKSDRRAVLNQRNENKSESTSSGISMNRNSSCVCDACNSIEVK